VPVSGALKVARFVLGLVRQAGRPDAARAEVVLVNGDLGLLVHGTGEGANGAKAVMTFAIDGGLVTGVFNQLNPAKLVGVPEPEQSWPPAMPPDF
jgi:RNA polymerase sigma-70 factor (ECF subfamily)